MTDDLTPIPAKDQTNFLLGRLEGTVQSLKDTVTASATAQASANTRHETEHAEFRADISRHEAELAVLRDSRKQTERSGDNRIQKWMVLIGVPGAVLSAAGCLAWLLANHP